MFLKHLKDDPDLEAAIRQDPDQYYFQEKIDGSSVKFKLDDNDILHVYRKLSRTIVTDNNIRYLIENNTNFSVVSLINAYIIINGRINRMSMIRGKEYYAEIIDTVTTVPAVEYQYNSATRYHLFIFDPCLSTVGARSGYLCMLTLHQHKLEYASYEMYIGYSLNILPITPFSALSDYPGDLFNNAIDRCTLTSKFKAIEGIVILDKKRAPISKIIPDYDLFTLRRKQNRSVANFLNSAKTHKVEHAAAWIMYYCNMVQHLEHLQTPETTSSTSTAINKSLPAKFHRTNEYISQIVCKE